MPAEQVIKCHPGDLFVHRNIANIVSYNDVNLAAVLQYGIEHLGIPDIVVCGHYGCGGIKAACEERVVGGYIGDWLMIAGWAKRWVDLCIRKAGIEVPPSDKLLQLVVDENVRLQIKHLSSLSMVRAAWEKHPGLPRLHGWVYDIRTGLIKEIESTSEVEGAARLAGEA